jgi:hypothetical protein
VCSLRQPLPDVLRRTIAAAGLIHKTSIASKVKFPEAERRPVNGTNRQLPETWLDRAWEEAGVGRGGLNGDPAPTSAWRSRRSPAGRNWLGPGDAGGYRGGDPALGRRTRLCVGLQLRGSQPCSSRAGAPQPVTAFECLQAERHRVTRRRCGALLGRTRSPAVVSLMLPSEDRARGGRDAGALHQLSSRTSKPGADIRSDRSAIASPKWAND